LWSGARQVVEARAEQVVEFRGRSCGVPRKKLWTLMHRQEHSWRYKIHGREPFKNDENIENDDVKSLDEELQQGTSPQAQLCA
jgi:hypothetical protein